MSKVRPSIVDWNLPSRRATSSAGKPRSASGASTFLPNTNITPMKSMAPTRPRVKPGGKSREAMSETQTGLARTVELLVVGRVRVEAGCGGKLHQVQVHNVHLAHNDRERSRPGDVQRLDERGDNLIEAVRWVRTPADVQ